MTIRRFEDLVAWQRARKLIVAVYAASRVGAFAKDYSFKDQIRRAVISIGSNIAEGFDRGNNKEFLFFLGIAKGSAAEARSQLYSAFDLGYVEQKVFDDLFSQLEEVAKLINGLISSLRKTDIAGTRYHKL